MITESIDKKGAGLRDGIRLYPENDKEIASLIKLQLKSDPERIKMEWQGDSLVYLYIPVDHLAEIASQ
jgi:hypothetical protein